jgi:hypothetical protein
VIGHVAGTQGRVGLPDEAGERCHKWADLGFGVVGRTGFEPVTSSVSGNSRGVCNRRTESNLESLSCEKNLTGSRWVWQQLNTLAPISGSHGVVPDLRLAPPDGAAMSLLPVIIRP